MDSAGCMATVSMQPCYQISNLLGFFLVSIYILSSDPIDKIQLMQHILIPMKQLLYLLLCQNDTIISALNPFPFNILLLLETLGNKTVKVKHGISTFEITNTSPPIGKLIWAGKLVFVFGLVCQKLVCMIPDASNLSKNARKYYI